MQWPSITNDVLEQHGITLQEWEQIQSLVGRVPNYIEMGMFSVMWSEHCSYKNTKSLLRLFPKTGEGVLVAAGEENAGAVDVGDGWAVVFKVESHNHPSAVEPYQGAATGVGGILRDIFTMGARPLFLMNSLRFGHPETERQKYLISKVIDGIAGYGNCIGVPTIGGEFVSDACYEENPLVNVFCLGVVKHEDLVKGAAAKDGATVYYVGAKTGRDGIHGATFASEDLTEESCERKSSVQVGDPFMEKCVLEACLEVMQRGLVCGVQDMGAAGLTCSISEMASRGGLGIDVALDKVPLREEKMNPYEVLLSESQERMLCVVSKENEVAFEEVFARWDVPFAPIGKVVDTGTIEITWEGESIVSLPLHALTEGAPEYKREGATVAKPLPLPSGYSHKVNVKEALMGVLALPEVASKQDVYEQFDHMVQNHLVCPPGQDASVVRLRGTDKAIVASLDGNGYYCSIDPYVGGIASVLEATRNVVCSGATPIGVTNCLNFGNPHDKEVYAAMEGVVRGLSDACRGLELPVTGGNVSLYNQAQNGAVYPTPVVGVVGVCANWEEAPPPPQFWQEEGALVYLVGHQDHRCDGSLYAREFMGGTGSAPYYDIAQERALYGFVQAMISQSLLGSVHDCSSGGLAVALVESCFGRESFGYGLRSDGSFLAGDGYGTLFSEAQGRCVVSVSAKDEQTFCEGARQHGVPITSIGVVGGDAIQIGSVLDCSIQDAWHQWRFALRKVWQ